MSDLYYRLVQRRDTAANWESENPVLENGEIGIVTDAVSDDARMKIGDGTTAWNSLSYFKGTDTDTTYTAGDHIEINDNIISLVMSDTIASNTTEPVSGKTIFNYVDQQIGNISTVLSTI